MYISVNKTYYDYSLKMLCLTIFVALFGGIYELFGHEVYSYYMIYAFAVPLILGVIPYYIISKGEKEYNKEFPNLLNCAIYTLTMGCVYKGVLDIYGTTNKLINIYWYASGLLLVMALFNILIFKPKKISET